MTTATTTKMAREDQAETATRASGGPAADVLDDHRPLHLDRRRGLSWARPQNWQVTTEAPAAGSPSVAPQPWQRLAVGTRQICHVAFAAGKSTTVDTASPGTLQLHP